jgi:hypothetical protein
MNELLDLLRSYRAGRAEYGTVHARFVAAGWDQTDVDLILQNTAYTPPGDLADQFLDQQQRRRRKQANPLMQGR